MRLFAVSFTPVALPWTLHQGRPWWDTWLDMNTPDKENLWVASQPPICRDRYRWQLGVLMAVVPLPAPLALITFMSWEKIGPATIPLIAVLVAAYIWRVQRCGAHVDGGVITVRNVYRNYRLLISDVADVSAGCSPGNKSVEFVSLRRKGRLPRVLIHASSARSQHCRMRWMDWAKTIAPVAVERRQRRRIGDYLA